jgi:hydrogenase maturation protein HypF
VSPDIAVCDDCLSEMWDPADRRFRYPFINCTNCGPRFTITRRLPYDRPNTTMAEFQMCSDCLREYEDPKDRRFHAQPVACPRCGPRVWFEDSSHLRIGPGADGDTDRVIAASQLALERGEIIAVKGIGGYHLACDATSEAAVSELRRRKNRPDKPLAVMVGCLADARRLADMDSDEAQLLSSPQRPVVLLKAEANGQLALSVAPDNPFVGIILPYSPLHHLLFHAVPGEPAQVPRALVMTSGNLSNEPICYEDSDARDRLEAIADAWLAHDRPIHVPCDDSVVRIESRQEAPIRRSRGYAPLPIRMPFEVLPMLATGGELKNTFCVASGSDAWLSQHIGDMGSVETLKAFEGSTHQFCDLYAVHPEVLVSDAHPGYQVRRWADDHDDGHAALVQHHHAHIAAAMVENSVGPDERVIGFAFDGTGYGTDGAIWGGEVLVAGYRGFDRAAHLRYVPLPGGDAAIRKPYRSALAHLRSAHIDWSADLPPVQFATEGELRVIDRQLERNFQCVPTSSMGRLFDAVSSLLGVRHTVSYEAQAAIELEAIAVDHLGSARDYEFDIAEDELDQSPVLRGIVSDLSAGFPVGAIAAGFHLSVARLIGDCAEQSREATGIELVALSGGVFQNLLLVRLARAELESRGFCTLTHRVVPPNDGGLALGQVAVACGIRSSGSEK